MIRLTEKQILLEEYFTKKKTFQEAIDFYNERILKMEYKRQKAISGAAKKSLSVEHAIENLRALEQRLFKVLKKANDENSMKFEDFSKLTDWYEQTQRQIKQLEKTQRKRVNVFEFSHELIDAIKERATLLDMIEELNIRKTRSGAGRYVILCPFHDEKTPSCMIYIKEDKYHCFGCGVHGDVIDFYQGILDLEFDEALIRLTDRLGIMVMDADQVESAEEIINDYKKAAKECEDQLRQLKVKYKEVIRK